ncbi:DUF4279 domain-containing protein [Pseudonocardiaceae bacterium YIM PH 21723]|nr:DUF4279 domain-containing protein [Pseudonocardiaceae bacterium YIM PH 21723]
MHIRQHVYFGLLSSQVPATEITARLGLEADEVKVRGSKRATPAVPVSHAWKIVCAEPGLAVDEQIGRVMRRLAPHSAEIIALAQELRAGDPQYGGAVLRVVRYFDNEDEDADEDELNSPLLGWALDRETLSFLLAVDAVLDIEEYA